MEEESNAIQEVAKATKAAIETAREFGGFISRYTAGPLEQGMGIFEDHLRHVRWERQARLMMRAEHFLRASGLSNPSRAVPLKMALPILQIATIEDNDDLQDRWATLLANAANADFKIEIQRSFISILEQLSPLEIRILEVMYALPFELCQHEGILTSDLPHSASINSKDNTHWELPTPDVSLALGNLDRLGCIRSGRTWGGGENLGRVNPTILGKFFVEACRPRELPQSTLERSDARL